MESSVENQQVPRSAVTVRLYYLDWLRVIAVLGVFVIHVTLVFNEIDFQIKNAEQSSQLTTFGAFFFPWGMPLLFLIAGAGSWFALQRRTPGQYVHERFDRLLIPFVVGTVLLSTMERYFEWSNKIQLGLVTGSFLEFIEGFASAPFPRIVAAVGVHLWFLGFLFCYALLTLPLFRWLRGDVGQRFIAQVARLCDHRGGILLFLLPLLIVRLTLQPVYSEYLHWTDFFFFLGFYILGYLLVADQRFMRAIRRDWPITLTVGIIAFLAAAAISITTDEFDLELVPRMPLHWIWWACFTYVAGAGPLLCYSLECAS